MMVSRLAIQRENLFDFAKRLASSGTGWSPGCNGLLVENPVPVPTHVPRLDGRQARARTLARLVGAYEALQLSGIGGVVQPGFEVHNSSSNQPFNLCVEVLHAF
jgi:hypothetical protein